MGASGPPHPQIIGIADMEFVVLLTVVSTVLNHFARDKLTFKII